MRWTGDAVAMLAKCLRALGPVDGLRAASVEFGEVVTEDAARNALKRHGLRFGDVVCDGAEPRRAIVPPPLDPDTEPAPSRGVDRVAIIPDAHVPEHDPIAFGVALRAVEVFAPDVVVVLGDFGDFASVSFHSKSPAKIDHLYDEVAAVNEQLDRLDAASASASRKVFCFGNHEHRVDRFIADKAAPLYGLVDLAQMLRLEERGWEVVPYREHATVGKLHVTHDCGHFGKYAAHRTLESFGGNVAHGHSHNAQVVYRGSARGESHVGTSLGWLGDPKHVKYMHKIATTRNWQHGIGAAYVERDSGNVHLNFLPIIDGRCVVEGQIVS